MDVPVSEGDHVTNGNGDIVKGAPPPPSPLTGCYLLIVVGEPYSEEHKDIILQRIAKGLLSWDVENCHVDLEKELQAITDVGPEGEETRHGERLIQFATENLVTEVLIHPAANTLIQCMKNLLSSFTRHRHIIHSGYTFGGNGSWALQDGTFSLADFTEAFQENEVQRVIKAYENTITIDIHCSTEGDWTRLPKESFTKSCKVQVNPNDVLTSGSPSINSFVNYLSPFLLPVDIETLLESSDVVGNIRFSHPTLYVFPGGQGDAALFGINGFNMLVDGGYARKACFWDFTRHLDRLDAVLVTRLNNSNVCGVSSVLKRKTNTQVYPQIGHFFCNLQERKAISPDGDKDKDPLLINLLDEGQEIISNLRQLNLRPQLCYRDTEPINLYHKVGHGTLDMYVLSPAKDSKEVKEFLHKWNTNDQRLFASRKDPREFSFPLSNLVSICALLVWQPANPSDTITRLLFPGSTPQHKIFEGLDRLKHLEFMKHPICSAKSLTPSGSIMGLSKTKPIKAATVLDKILPSEHKQKILDNRPVKEKSPPINNKHENKMNGTVEENKISHTEKIIKSNSVESDKSEPKSETKKTEMNGKDVEIILEDKSAIKKKTESKPKQRVTKARSESSTRRSVEKKAKVEKKVETKASPPTPKKTVDSKVNGVAAKDAPRPKLLNRTGVKASPTSTPAKSTKDANNRKVIESKYKPAPKKEPIAKKEVVKTERKPISRRPKAASPTRSGKMPASPSKKLPGIKTDKNGISRTIKLDKEGTTDSSAVSTPSADQDISKKIDVTKLSKTELEELKAKELADLKEEQEVVKEIEAVFRKDDKLNESDQSDLRKIKDISLDDKTTEPEDEEEEYLIVEKEEVELNTDSVNEQESATKEDEIQKHQRDSEESEKPRKESDTDKNTGEKIEEEVPVEKEVQETKLIEADTCKVLEIISPQVKEEDNIVPTGEMTRSKEDSRDKTEEMSKEISSVTSPEDKIDVSSEKKLTDTRDVEEEENKEVQDQNVLESQPDEKFSATIESGATTAPTLPEDERIPLDEIKEDQVIEEKYVKEETKEKEVPAVVLPQKQFEPVPKISPIIGMKFDAHQSHIRDIVKTPDEVADLPVHEEVDIDTYDFPGYKKDVTKKGEVAEKPRDDVAKSSDKVEMKVKKESELADEVKPEKEDEIQAEVIDEADKKVPLEEDKTGITVTAIVEPTNESIKDTQQVDKDETVVKELETSEEKVVEDTKEKEEKTDIEKDKIDTEELLVDEEKPDEKEGEILTTIKDAIEEITATAKEDVKEISEKKESIKDVEATKEEIKTNLADAKELDSEKKSIVSDEKNLEEVQTRIDTEEEDKNVTDDDKTKAVISEVDTKNVEDKQDDVEQENNIKKDAKVFRSEAEIVRIVSNVAHVLKSDAPLEELAPTLPIEYSPTFKPFALKGYTTELRETHITTLDSPVHEDVIIPTKETSQEIKEICPKQSTISFLNEERKLSGEKALEETVTKSDISPQEKKISDLIKDSNALIASTSKIISNIKSSTVAEKDDEIQSEKISEETIKTDEIIEEDQNLEQADQNLEQVDQKLKESDQNLEQVDQKLNESDQNLEQVDQKEDDENNGIGTVHRMLVTASSEDGGEETVICPTGSIKFIKDSSGRSTPDIAISPPKEDEETVNDEGEKSPIKKDSIVDTMSGKSSPKLTDDKIASGRTTPEIIIDLDETEIDENADENYVVDQSDQLKSADTTADPVIEVTENKTITDDSKLEEKLELVEETTKPTDMDLKESKQIVSDKTSPDIKDEISETSTKEDVETVKELSPVSTDKDKVLELKDDQSGKATQDQKIDATSSDDKEKITDSLPETKDDTELKRDSISGPLSPGLKTDLNTIVDISGKSTPEPKQILSGKSTPDLKDKLESGKATPDMTKIESGKATPDLKEKRDSLQSETKDDSGKATPDITEKKDSLTETKEDSGKATPDLKEKSDSLQPETKQDSGKATDLADKQDSLPDAKEDSGKATPDLKEKRDSLPIESKEESGKTTPDLKEKRDSIQSETKVESGKATPDLQEKQDSSKTESKEQSGKVTPDLQEKRDSLKPESKEHSGKATPDLQEKRDSLQAESKEHSGKTTPDLQEKRDSIQLETKQESGKATPDLQEKQDSLQSVTKQDSGKATPDLTDKRDSLIPDAKDASGKATPDLTDKRDSLIPDVKDTSGKTSPDLKDKVESGKATPNLEEKRDSLKPESKEQSGKTTPDFTDSLQPESKIESGKATPDLQEKRDSLKPESKEHSGKSTPDFTDSLQPETKVDSGKATPDLQEKHDSLKLESKDQSGKSTPEFTDSLQPETKVDSGKATPDLQEKRDSLKPESKEHSGKVTPDLQEKRDSIQLETKIESGKATPDLQEKRDSIQIDSKQESGKTTPDLQEKQDSLQPQTKQDSGKATPDLKEKRGSLIVEEKENSGKSSPHLKEESGESTPDIKEKTTDDKVVISGKSSPLPESSPKEDVIAKNERSESIISVTSVKSGKSSPDFKENERISTPDHHITDTKNTSGKSSPMPEIKSTDLTTDKSGKSTPDIKDASGKSTPDLKQEEIKSSKQSGKSTPDPQVNISEIKDISGKSTPDLKQEQISAVDLHEQSGKTTPDIKQDDIKSSLTNDISGKSTPDIKKDEVKSISGLSDKSGKSTPDLKNEDSQVHLPSDIQKVTDEFEKSTEIINEIVSSASTIEILSTSDIKVDISGKSSPSLIREEIKSRASITSVQSGKSTPELITEVHGDAKNISGKTTPDLKHEILTGTQSGKSTPDIKANEVKIETGQSTPDLKVNNISGSGKSTPDLKGENISARATPDLHEDLNLDRKSIVSITSEKSGTSTPDFKEDISARATPEIPDIKCERKSIVSSGKTTPDLKEDISARGTPDIHDITCDRKSIVSITSEKSGKSTPDIKEDISARATPDITCDSKSIISITSEKSGKSTPDLKEDISACATPDIHDITSDRKSIVSITTDKSGKSTPDLKEDISARATPDITCDRKSIVSIASEKSGKSTPDLKEDVSARETPDITCDRKSIVSITSEKSGKSTPDLKEDGSARETPDITCDRKSIVSITSEKSGKSTPDLKEDVSAHATPEIQDAKSEHRKSTPDMKVESLESSKTSDDKQESGKSTISILNGSGKSTPDIQITIGKSTDDSKKDDLLSEKDTSLTDVSKDSQPTVITTEVTELSVAGPSHIQRDDSIPSSGQISPLNKDLQHLSSEDLHLSGKSTPDIADVERMKEIHEILKHEKHIPGSSTPPTVPVSPIVKESFSLQSEEVKDKKELPLVQEKMDVPKETEVVEKQTSTLVVTKTKVEDLTISKDSETQKSDRCATPGSDDCDFGGVSSPHSDISSGQMSRVAHAWGHGSSEERQAYSDDDDVPGSPTSVTSQMAHSPPTHFTDVEFESGPESILHKTKKHDPMSASLYGALPDETTEHSVLKTSTQPIPITTASTTSSHIDISKTKETEKRFLDEADLDFEKAMLEHRQTRGSDLIGSDKTESVNYKYEITTAKFTKPTLENGKDNGMQMKEIKNGFDTCESVSHSTKTDSPKKSSPEMMTSSFIEGSSSSSSQQSQEVKKDPIESWGKPLGLPSPALPPTSDMSNKTTPKKMPPSATLAAKNKINDERKRSDSPSKYDKKNKKMSPVYLDLTYVPHHGNSYYSFVEFFKRVRARYYVFSGTEPSKEVYNALLEAKQTWEDKELEVTIIPTYDTDVLGYWVAENEDLLAKHKIDLSPSASRCTINLQDHETSCSAYRLEF